jgi:predicted metal-dependent hydrolase
MDFPPVELNEKKLQVQVILTRNRNAYARVRNGSIVISLPSRMREDSSYKVAYGLYNRIKKDILARPEKYLYDKNNDLTFYDNQTLNLLDRQFTFHISDSNTKNAKGSLKANEIFVQIPQAWTEDQKNKAIYHLGRRILSKEMLSSITQRVHDINYLHFKSDISNVRLANASSRWGSCTTRRGMSARIMLNFKLLFLPIECMDYVIVHELAHTKLHNHSKNFWRIVAAIIPDYKERIKLLKQSSYKIKTGDNA